MKDDSSPVYAGSPGDPNFYKLSEKFDGVFGVLFRFFKFFGNKEKMSLWRNYIVGTGDLLERYLSPNVQATAKEYLLR